MSHHQNPPVTDANPYVAPRTPQEQAYRQQQAPQMPTDVTTRKGTPMARGLLDYFQIGRAHV